MGYFDPSPPSITPTLGAEKLTNTSFEANLTGWSWRLNCVPTRSTDTAHDGSWSAYCEAQAAAAVVFGQDVGEYLPATPGGTYVASYWVYSGYAKTASVYLVEFDNVPNWVDESDGGGVVIPVQTWTKVTRTFTVSVATTQISVRPRFATDGIGQFAYFDDVSIKEMVLASMLGSVQDMGGESVTQQVKLTIPANQAAGMVFGVESVAAPQNLVRVIYDRGTAKVHIWQLVSSVWTELQATATTYVANAPLKAQKINNQITVWYNGALVGSANIACTANPYMKHGLMATDVSVTFADFASDISGGIGDNASWSWPTTWE